MNFWEIRSKETETQLESYLVLTDFNQSYPICSKCALLSVCNVADNSLHFKLRYCRRCTFPFKLGVHLFHV